MPKKQETAEDGLLFQIKPITRKKMEGEATLFDKDCPVCKTGKLIGRWDHKERRYVSFRCQGITCPYGNGRTVESASGPKLPELEFEI